MPFYLRQLTKSLTKSLSGSVSDLVVASQCPVCNRNASLSENRTTPTPFCIDCQRQITAACYAVQGWHMTTTDPIAVGALGEYRGTLKQAILALKYKNRPEVARSLGADLANRWLTQAQLQTDIYAVPIPLHPNRLAQRGYNQAALIANTFGRVSGIQSIEHGLVRIQDTAPQHQLGVEGRQRNLASAFTLGKALKRLQNKTKTPSHILLIDDIYTTGTTAQSAAQVLIAAGCRVDGILSLARAVNNE